MQSPERRKLWNKSAAEGPKALVGYLQVLRGNTALHIKEYRCSGISRLFCVDELFSQISSLPNRKWMQCGQLVSRQGRW